MRIPDKLGVLVERLKKDYPKDFPEILCRRARGMRYSSGTYYSAKNTIRLRLGRSPNDKKLILLHEFAHSLNRQESHSRRFWETAFDLYKKYGVDLRYARRREKRYKVEADIVSRERLGLKKRRNHRHTEKIGEFMYNDTRSSFAWTKDLPLTLGKGWRFHYVCKGKTFRCKRCGKYFRRWEPWKIKEKVPTIWTEHGYKVVEGGELN
jgi:hypothetical protein